MTTRYNSRTTGSQPVRPTVRPMNTHSHSRCCPSCGHHFVPWATWRISRWSCLRCPSCSAQLNRRLDAQFFLVWFSWIFPCSLLAGFSSVIGIPVSAVVSLTVIAFFLAWLVDLLTVRLVVAGRWRGLLVMSSNNFVKATPVFAILLVWSHMPGAPYDNRYTAKPTCGL